MKSDSQIKSDVLAELKWDPAIDETDVGVLVDNGVVTLTGHLNSFAEKFAAERAARRVAGVRGIAVELDVKISARHKRSDSEIAQAATNALRWNSFVPDDKIQVEVDNGWITLRGTVDWQYQSTYAEQSMRPLVGVRGVSNTITVKPHPSTSSIVAGISAALARHAAREALKIQVDVDGDVVTLKGKVDSLAEHDAAVAVAFNAAGVARVVDKLEVVA